jgi:UDP-N-acetylmuramate--alanine ligase
VTYGVGEEADIRLVDLESDAAGTRFTMTRDGQDLGRVMVRLSGEHNAMNAAAAVIAGLELGLDFEALAAGCSTFEGVARRFEVLGERRGVTVIDDYAHHPTELNAVLTAVHQVMPGRRIVAVFQPHL